MKEKIAIKTKSNQKVHGKGDIKLEGISPGDSYSVLGEEKIKERIPEALI